jgi:ubiquinone/menaquinone biosynthesis C-methylase UbiE
MRTLPSARIPGRARIKGAPVSLRGRIFAAGYDRIGAGVEAAGLGAHREALLAGARGRVLEIGAGTGRNLEYYGDAIESLTCAEPDAAMARRLERRIGARARPVKLVRAPAEVLPFEDGSFDVVVSTLVLCTVEDQSRALAEAHRVLTPGGELLFIEHVRSDRPKLACWQDRLNGVNRFVAQGCNCNRDTVEAIRAARFTIERLDPDELKHVPVTVRPLVVGAARRG